MRRRLTVLRRRQFVPTRRDDDESAALLCLPELAEAEAGPYHMLPARALSLQHIRTLTHRCVPTSCGPASTGRDPSISTPVPHACNSCINH